MLDNAVAGNTFRAPNKVVSVAPGRSPIISAIVHNQAAMDTITNDEGNVHHATLKVSKKDFIHVLS